MHIYPVYRHKNKLYIEKDDGYYSSKTTYRNILGSIFTKDFDNDFIFCREYNYLEEEFQFFIILDENNKVICKAIIFYSTIEHFAIENKRIHISSFITIKYMRNKGIGTFFLKEIFRIFQNYQITLGVDKNNKNAYELYKKMNFKCFRENVQDYEKRGTFDLLISSPYKRSFL